MSTILKLEVSPTKINSFWKKCGGPQSSGPLAPVTASDSASSLMGLGTRYAIKQKRNRRDRTQDWGTSYLTMENHHF
jgi:hypothetical protein